MSHVESRSSRRRVLKRHKRRHQATRARYANDVDLRCQRQKIGFLFRIFSFVYSMTKRAGVSAIKGLSNRLAQSRVLRVLDHHRCPRN